MSDSDLTVGWREREWNVYEKVRAFVADAADVPLEQVHPGSDIYKNLGVDSLGLVLIMVNLESTFDVKEPENVKEIGPELNTPAAIVAFALKTERRGT